jgi:hypothetical protein
MFGLIYLRYPVQMLVSCPSLAALGIGRMQTKQKNIGSTEKISNTDPKKVKSN